MPPKANARFLKRVARAISRVRTPKRQVDPEPEIEFEAEVDDQGSCPVSEPGSPILDLTLQEGVVTREDFLPANAPDPMGLVDVSNVVYDSPVDRLKDVHT